jgi:hypothetical protein
MLEIIAAAFFGLAAAQSPDTTTMVTVQEDSPQWDCTTMGNRICGVGNAQGVPASSTSPITPPSRPRSTSFSPAMIVRVRASDLYVNTIVSQRVSETTGPETCCGSAELPLVA